MAQRYKSFLKNLLYKVSFFSKIHPRHLAPWHVSTFYEIFVATSRLSEQAHPEISKYRKTLFWDTDFDTLDWQRNSEWIIQRVFEYGNESEIKETIRFYGKRKIINVMKSIKDTWNSKNRMMNLKNYLNYKAKN